jgi:hypothetical protein
MHKTIEALYKDGKIIPLRGTFPLRDAKVLVTFLDVNKRNVIIGKKAALKLRTYHNAGKLRDFTREDAYAERI